MQRIRRSPVETLKGQIQYVRLAGVLFRDLEAEVFGGSRLSREEEKTVSNGIGLNRQVFERLFLKVVDDFSPGLAGGVSLGSSDRSAGRATHGGAFPQSSAYVGARYNAYRRAYDGSCGGPECAMICAFRNDLLGLGVFGGALIRGIPGQDLP